MSFLWRKQRTRCGSDFRTTINLFSSTEFSRSKLILEYHPQMLQEYLRGGEQTSFMHPSGVDRFKRQFAHLEDHPGKGKTPVLRQNCSLPRERVIAPKDKTSVVSAVVYATSEGPLKSKQVKGSENAQDTENGVNRPNCSAHSLLKSASISASQCVVVKEKKDNGEAPIPESMEEAVDEVSDKVSALND